VLGPLDRPFAHLAFDDSGVLAVAAGWERFGEDLSDRLLLGGVAVLGGKDPAVCGLSGGRRGGCV